MSGWRSKKNMSNYRFSWTQSYPGWQPKPVMTLAKAVSTLDELIRLYEIDKEVESRLTYPEAESIIKHIANNSKRNPNA